MDIWLTLVSVVPSVIIATVAVTVFFYNRKKDAQQKRLQLFQIIEQNFDVLQRLNEAALKSGQHARAAMQSVNRDENPPEQDAMIVFFHYLRLNRMFRLYEYRRHKFIDEFEFRRVFDSYKGTLLDAVPLLDELAPRGYPSDFIEFLKQNVAEEHRAPKLENLSMKLEGVQNS